MHFLSLFLHASFSTSHSLSALLHSLKSGAFIIKTLPQTKRHSLYTSLNDRHSIFQAFSSFLNCSYFMATRTWRRMCWGVWRWWWWLSFTRSWSLLVFSLILLRMRRLPRDFASLTLWMDLLCIRPIKSKLDPIKHRMHSCAHLIQNCCYAAVEEKKNREYMGRLCACNYFQGWNILVCKNMYPHTTWCRKQLKIISKI